MASLRALAAKALGSSLLTRIPGREPRLFLTFDDGPHPTHTPALLEVLARHRAIGTFFMVGREVASAPDATRAVASSGHALGNHTLTHPRMDRLAPAARRFEIESMDAMLARFDGRQTHLFRPPYGHLSAAVIAQCLAERRRIAYWSRDSFDFRQTAAEVVDGFDADPVRNGDILLFHDDAGVAAEALDVLLARWTAAGFRFERLPAPRSA